MRYKFETNIILTLIGIVLIPIVLFSFVFSNVYRDYIGNVQTELLESVRNEKIQQIKGRFSDMELLFEHYSNTVILEAIESGVNDFTADEMKAQVNGLHDVYIFDGNKEKLYSISEHEQESFDVKRILQTTNFTAPIKIVDYNRQNSGLVMMVMEKLVHNGVTEGYVCYLINCDFFKGFAELKETYKVDIYDNGYRLIASNSDRPLNEIYLNELTKNMIDGFTEVLTYEGIRTAYGFAALDESTIFVSVGKSESKVMEPYRTLLIYCGFIGTIVLAFTLLISWKFIKSIRSYIRNIFLKDDYKSKELSILEGQVESVIEDIEKSIQLNLDLQNLKDKMELILSKLPKEHDYYDKKHLFKIFKDQDNSKK